MAGAFVFLLRRSLLGLFLDKLVCERHCRVTLIAEGGL
jgi:hypothetical protein